MFTKWTAHCKDEHSKAQFEADLRRAKPVLERLSDIVEHRISDITTDELDKASFDTAAWPYAQAATVGARRELMRLKLLIDLDKQKDAHE